MKGVYNKFDLKNIIKSQKNNCNGVLFLKKLSPGPEAILKIGLHYRCLPVNFGVSFKTPILQNSCGRLLYSFCSLFHKTSFPKHHVILSPPNKPVLAKLSQPQRSKNIEFQLRKEHTKANKFIINHLIQTCSLYKLLPSKHLIVSNVY